nr:YfhO family protein [Lachnospiraceae bacterium]
MDSSKTGINKYIKKESAIYICAFLMSFILIQIFYAMCGIYPYGKYTVLIGDLDSQFVAFYKYFLNAFTTKNDMVYMMSKTIGGDVPGLAAYYLHDPFILLLFLFPNEKIATGVAFMFAIQLSLAGLSMSLLLNKRYGVSWISLVFSTAYSFIGFFFDYNELTIYFTCLALLPLIILLFLSYLDDKVSMIPFILSVAFFIYINYYLGFMLVIFLGLLYLSRLITDLGYIKKLKGLIYCLITILMIDGFFLIRTVYVLKGEKSTENANYGLFRNFPFMQLFASFFSGTSRNIVMPMIYCSVTALFFAVFFFLSKRYGKREKTAALFMLFTLFISMWLNTLDSVWHGFNNPEGFLWRYSYYASIMVIVLGYKGFRCIIEGDDEKKRNMIKTGLIFAGMILYLFWLRRIDNPYLDQERLVVNVLFVTVIAVVAVTAVFGGRLKIISCFLLMIISVTDMLYNARTVYMRINAGDGELPLISAFEDDYKEIEDTVSYIKQLDNGFYRFEKDYENSINDPAMFDYIGLSHNSSCERDDVIDWLKNFGFCKTIYYTYYNGGSTSFADAFFGVKYFGADQFNTFKPYEYIDDVAGHGIYRNPYALPLVFAAPGDLSGFEMDDTNTFEKQNRIASCWSKDFGNIYKKAEASTSLEGAEEIENGHFVKKDEEAYIVYNINVTEEMPILMYFSAPERQSGEIFVNGESHDWYFTENHWNVLYAGTFKPGDTVEVKMQILKDDLRITEACFYYEDAEALAAWAKEADRANKNMGEVNEIASSHLSFEAGTDEGDIIIASVPYDSA